MPPTLETLEGPIVFGLFVNESVGVSLLHFFKLLKLHATVLKFHIHIPHEKKIVDPYF